MGFFNFAKILKPTKNPKSRCNWFIPDFYALVQWNLKMVLQKWSWPIANMRFCKFVTRHCCTIHNFEWVILLKLIHTENLHELVARVQQVIGRDRIIKGEDYLQKKMHLLFLQKISRECSKTPSMYLYCVCGSDPFSKSESRFQPLIDLKENQIKKKKKKKKMKRERERDIWIKAQQQEIDQFLLLCSFSLHFVNLILNFSTCRLNFYIFQAKLPPLCG